MNQILLRNVSVYARTRLLSPPCCNPSRRSQLAPLAASNRPRLSFYSTESPSPNKEGCNDAEDDVSNEELKRRMEDFFGGNEEAIPSIFEAVLKRELTGKHDASEYDKLMNEIQGNKEAIPPSSIFEAVLKRELTGKHDQTEYNKLIEENQCKKPLSDIDGVDQEIESDFEESSGSDGEIDEMIYDAMDKSSGSDGEIDETIYDAMDSVMKDK